jgi:hypothetical protein
VGVKVTLIVHLPFATTELPQVLVWAKSPLTATLVIDNAVVRLLVSVTEIGLLVVPTVRLAKVTVAGDRVTGKIPVPEVEIICGLLVALSVIVTVPLTAPVAAGVKLTEMVHFFPAPTELPQVLVSAKFALATMLEIVNVAVPVFVRVTFLTALVDPTTTLPNPREVGESVTDCADAAPTKSSKVSASPPKTPRHSPRIP